VLIGTAWAEKGLTKKFLTLHSLRKRDKIFAGDRRLRSERGGGWSHVDSEGGKILKTIKSEKTGRSYEGGLEPKVVSPPDREEKRGCCQDETQPLKLSPDFIVKGHDTNRR